MYTSKKSNCFAEEEDEAVHVPHEIGLLFDYQVWALTAMTARDRKRDDLWIQNDVTMSSVFFYKKYIIGFYLVFQTFDQIKIQ